MILLLGMQHSFIKDRLIVLVIDVAIEKYLIGIQLLSIYIRVNFYPTTSIGTSMGRCGKKLLKGKKTVSLWIAQVAYKFFLLIYMNKDQILICIAAKIDIKSLKIWNQPS